MEITKAVIKEKPKGKKPVQAPERKEPVRGLKRKPDSSSFTQLPNWREQT
jgi:hypothetical protein